MSLIAAYLNAGGLFLVVTVYLVLGIVALFAHLQGSRSTPVPLPRQLDVKHV